LKHTHLLKLAAIQCYNKLLTSSSSGYPNPCHHPLFFIRPREVATIKIRSDLLKNDTKCITWSKSSYDLELWAVLFRLASPTAIEDMEDGEVEVKTSKEAIKVVIGERVHTRVHQLAPGLRYQCGASNINYQIYFWMKQILHNTCSSTVEHSINSVLLCLLHIWLWSFSPIMTPLS